MFSGGGEGNRTPGLDCAIVALYQLSYTPVDAVASLAVASCLRSIIWPSSPMQSPITGAGLELNAGAAGSQAARNQLLSV